MMTKNRMIFKTTKREAREEMAARLDLVGFDLGLDVYSYTQCAEEVRKYLLPEDVLVTLYRKGGWYSDTVRVEFFDPNSHVLSDLVVMLKDLGYEKVSE